MTTTPLRITPGIPTTHTTQIAPSPFSRRTSIVSPQPEKTPESAPNIIASKYPNYYEITYLYPSRMTHQFSYVMQMYDKHCSVADVELLDEWRKANTLVMRNLERRVTRRDADESKVPVDSIGINEIVRRLILPNEVRRVKVPEYKARGKKEESEGLGATAGARGTQDASTPNATVEQHDFNHTAEPTPYFSPQWFDQFPILLVFGALWDTKSKGLIQNIHGIFCKEDGGCESKIMQAEVKRRLQEKQEELRRQMATLTAELEQLKRIAEETIPVPQNQKHKSYQKALNLDKLSLDTLSQDARALVQEIRGKEKVLASLPNLLKELAREEAAHDAQSEKRRMATARGSRGGQRFLQYIAIYVPLDNEEDAYQEFVDQLASGFDIGGRALAWYALKFSDSEEKQSLTRSLMQLFRVSQVPHVVYLHPIDDVFGSLPMRAYTQDTVQRKIFHTFVKSFGMKDGGEDDQDEGFESPTQSISSLGEETKYQMEMLRTLGETRRITPRFAQADTSSPAKKRPLKSLQEMVKEKWTEVGSGSTLPLNEKIRTLFTRSQAHFIDTSPSGNSNTRLKQKQGVQEPVVA